MENDSNVESKINNLVGIIPIAGHDDFDFQQPWPSCMMPIGPSYSLLEASIVECAYAGCKSIWIVVNDDISPLLRKTVGDWCEDPVWAMRNFDPVPGESRRKIPIYYVAVNPKDRHKRDCLSWSVIHGALTAFKIMTNVSDHMAPSEILCFISTFIFPAWQLRDHRKIISSSTNVYITSLGQSIKDGKFASFTFDKDDWLEFRRVVRTGTGKRVPGTSIDEDIYLDPSERWSARFFPVEKVFEPLDLDNSYEIPVEDYFDIRNWQEYVDFMAASRSINIVRPTKSILIKRRYNPLFEDD